MRTFAVSILLLTLVGCPDPGVDTSDMTMEEACVATGGTVSTSACCSDADFPDTCGDGACGCDPDVSVEVLVCACPGSAGCWDSAANACSEQTP